MKRRMTILAVAVLAAAGSGGYLRACTPLVSESDDDPEVTEVVCDDGNGFAMRTGPAEVRAIFGDAGCTPPAGAGEAVECVTPEGDRYQTGRAEAPADCLAG